MANLTRSIWTTLRLLSGLLLAIAGLGLSSPPLTIILAAAENAPQSGGAFTVTSPADTNTNDSVLTLREALLVVRGGTGPAGLNRAVSAGEQAALAGCTFSAGNITTGCGVGFANSIAFTGSLGLHPVITLTASLPAITNTSPTTIDGSVNGVFPIVSAAAILTHTDALLIGSDSNTLSGVTIRSAPRDDLHVTGNGNQVLTGTVLLAASRYGLLVDGGQLNTFTSILVGTPSAVVGTCNQGNAQGGVVLDNGAMTNTVQLATVACNSGVGARFDGSGTSNNKVYTSTISVQTGDGVEIINGAWFNFVNVSTITSNNLGGILISGAASHNNVLRADWIGVTASGVAAGNGQYGLRLSAGTHDNTIAASHISGNGLGGVRLDTGATHNFLALDSIGLNPTDTAAVPNGGPGIDVDNAPNTQIGLQVLGVTVAGNHGPGVRFSNTTGGVIVPTSNIGTGSVGNDGVGVELINTTNTTVQATAVQNNAGPGIAIKGAASTGDLIAPFFVGQNGGLPIDLGNDGHTANGSHSPPGPNDWLNYPVITAATGSVITGTACVNCTVLIYIAIGNPAANGGGAVHLQNATADSAGHWAANLTGGYDSGDVTLQACTAPCTAVSDTSELSPRMQIWVPVVRR